MVAGVDDRTLVDIRTLVGTCKFLKVVNVHTNSAGDVFFVIYTNNDTVGVDVINNTAALCLNSRTGVNRNRSFDARTDNRFFRTETGNALTLHVGTHQSTVRVIVFQERNQGSSNGNDLCRSHVHVLNAFGTHQDEFAFITAADELVAQVALVIDGSVSLSNNVVAFIDCREVGDFVGYVTVDHFSVRCLKETVVVQTRIKSQRVNQTDVRTFRRFNRADTTVVSRMHVSNFEACALTSQAARAQCGNTALVRDFRQRVGLIHELAQLRRTEEVANSCADRFAVDQVMRHQIVGFGLSQTFTNGTLDTNKTGTELVFCQFTDTADATIAQVVNIVNLAFAVAKLNDSLHRIDDVFRFKRHRTGFGTAVEAGINLHAADAGQIVCFGIEEQTTEQCLNSFFCRRFARTHHAVDRNTCGQLIRSFVQSQSVGNVRTAVQFVDVQRIERIDAVLADLLKKFRSNFIVGVGHDFTGIFVIQIRSDDLTDEVVKRNRKFGNAELFDFTNVTGIDTLILGNNNFAFRIFNIKSGNFTAETRRNDLERGAVLGQCVVIEFVELLQNAFRCHAQCFEHDGSGHLAATVDTEVKNVFRIEFKVEPRAAVRNNTGAEQQFSGAVCLAAIVLKKYARRTMKLRYNNALGTVDDERSFFRHQRDFTHVNF